MLLGLSLPATSTNRQVIKLDPSQPGSIFIPLFRVIEKITLFLIVIDAVISNVLCDFNFPARLIHDTQKAILEDKLLSLIRSLSMIST